MLKGFHWNNETLSLSTFQKLWITSAVIASFLRLDLNQQRKSTLLPETLSVAFCSISISASESDTVNTDSGGCCHTEDKMSGQIPADLTENDRTWLELQQTLEILLTGKPLNGDSWAASFFCAHRVLGEIGVDPLFRKTKGFLEDFVNILCKDVCESDQGVLDTYCDHWQKYSRGVSHVNKIYRNLNRFVLKVKFGSLSSHFLSFEHLALDIWIKHMIDPQRSVLTSSLLAVISRVHQGSTSEVSVAKDVVTSLVYVCRFENTELEMKLYKDIFEVPFLAELGKNCRSYASRLKADCTHSEYLEKVLQLIDDEKMKFAKIVHPTTIQKMTSEWHQRLVEDDLTFLNGHNAEIVHQEKQKDLSNLHKLMEPVKDGLVPLMDHLEEHIRVTCLNAVRNLKPDTLPSQFVAAVVGVHTHFSELIHSAFNNDPKCIATLEKACTAVVGRKPSPEVPYKSPHFLVKYCDRLLKKSSKRVSDTDLDEQLTGCAIVYKYLDDKDIFQRFYAFLLAERLMCSLSRSMDAEKSMINKLKQVCDSHFTRKLQYMLADAAAASDHNIDFKNYLEDNSVKLDVSFSVRILQLAAWPVKSVWSIPFRVPQELEMTVNTFDAYYHGRYGGRKLRWLHCYSSGELKLNYLKRPYIVSMTSYMMSILLSFNAKPELAYSDISTSTGLPDQKLIQHLTALCEAKLLQTEGEVTTNSIFSLNMDYSNRHTIFKINVAPAQRDALQEVEKKHTAVGIDQETCLQSAIVRTMKSLQLLKHDSLVMERMESKRLMVPHLHKFS